jgi:hypothetical protein
MKAFRASLNPQTPARKPKPSRQVSGPRTYRALYVVRSESIVKLGISGNVEARLAQHRMQGLHHVVYILHSPDSDGIVALEKSWKSFVRSKPHLRVTREDLPDGYTEALPLTDEVKTFIDAMLKPHAEPPAPAEAEPPEQKWSKGQRRRKRRA